MYGFSRGVTSDRSWRNRKIGDTIDLGNETDRFPEAYRGDYDGELNYVTYEWQTTPNRAIQLISPHSRRRSERSPARATLRS